jgi:hypothetical protein
MCLWSLKKGVGSGSISQRYGSWDPDPHQNVTDPQHCLRVLQICRCQAVSILFMRPPFLIPDQYCTRVADWQSFYQLKINFLIWIFIIIIFTGAWRCWQEFTMRSKFKGKYLEIEPIGNCAYLLIIWLDESIPPCRRVSDTSRHRCGRSLPEVGVLNRNISGSAR